MRGPAILARSMSRATKRGTSPRKWQYHSRSDNHSKAACWTLMFDVLLECAVLRRHAEQGLIGFGINHVMVGPINKTLDLVITSLEPSHRTAVGRTFAEVADRLRIALDQDERALLAQLPTLVETPGDDTSEVAVAVEAKACMTEHVKSLPRLHAEILATGYLARRAARHCITVSYSLINAAPSFVTPSGSGKVNEHKQPDDARRVLDMLARAIPTAAEISGYGYDVIGAVSVDCRNDGSPVRVVEDKILAPQRDEHIHYERMVRNLCAEYRRRFGA